MFWSLTLNWTIFVREGRAALVTSFSCFKYMALYSIIQFTTVSFLYTFASNLGDFQFLYIDLVLILPIAVFMGRTEAFPVLSPKRPTAKLVSKKVLTSLIGQILIQGLFQASLFFMVRQQPWYKPPKYERGQKNIEGLENTSMFFLSIFQYLLVAIVFSVGPPYRKPMATNSESLCGCLESCKSRVLDTNSLFPHLSSQ
jgi:cation-transporting ATPase 13A2